MTQDNSWSDLPADLLALIVENLHSAAAARFRSVCTTWNSAPSLLNTPLETPWLVFCPSSSVHESSDGSNQQKSSSQKHDKQPNVSFYDICENKTYKFRCGSHHLKDAMEECRAIVSYTLGNWLMYMDKACELQCLHLTTGKRIHPPSITTFPEFLGAVTDSHGNITGYNLFSDGRPNGYFFSCEDLSYMYARGIILFPESSPDHILTTQQMHSTEGTNSEYIIVVSHHINQHVAFAKQGDSSWTLENVHFGISGFILHNNSLIGVSFEGCDFSHYEFNLDYSYKSTDILSPNFEYLNSGYDQEPASSYLVHLDDHLWLIWRFMDNEPDEDTVDSMSDVCKTFSTVDTMSNVCKTFGFRVFKFDESRSTWVEMNTIGDYAILIGSNTPLAFSTNDFPHMARNSIYFADDYAEGYIRHTCWDLGVFNLVDKTARPLYDPLVAPKFPQPTWIMSISL